MYPRSFMVSPNTNLTKPGLTSTVFTYKYAVILELNTINVGRNANESAEFRSTTCFYKSALRQSRWLLGNMRQRLIPSIYFYIIEVAYKVKKKHVWVQFFLLQSRCRKQKTQQEVLHLKPVSLWFHF